MRGLLSSLCLGQSARSTTRHANANAVGHLFEDHRLRTVRHAGRHLEPADDRARMHHERGRRMGSQAVDR